VQVALACLEEVGRIAASSETAASLDCGTRGRILTLDSEIISALTRERWGLLLLLSYSQAQDFVIQTSVSLRYEPVSQPLHIYVKCSFV